jgi:hypothetical protein
MEEIVKIDGDEVLLCPFCGSNYTHQQAVDVWVRDKEDSGAGVHCKVNQGKAVFSNEIGHGNPSGRRDGLSIEFSCENCYGTPILLVYQHKSQTFIEWKE